MSTIQQLISGYARIYKERPTQAEPELTKKDFLASLAIDRVIDSCAPDFQCAFNKLKLYDAGPDAFIDSYLGAKGSTVRILYENQAADMLSVAKKYSFSRGKDTKAHLFRMEMADIKANYLRCTITRGVVEYLSMNEVSKASQRSFERRLTACVDHKSKSEVKDDRPYSRRTIFDVDSYGRELPDAKGRRRGHIFYLKP